MFDQAMSDGTSRNAAASARQKTLKTAIHCTGVGLHSGAKVAMTLRPGPINSGIIFKRTDIAGNGAIIPATYDHVVDTRLCTVLGAKAADGKMVTIGTVEHLMAALSGCQIDNAVVELSGPEVPIMDGSAAPFVFLIECAGTREQLAPRRAIRVLKTVSILDDGRLASLEPGNLFSVSFEIDFNSRAVARQEYATALVNGSFKADIARARTFGFEHEVHQLRAAGLARGGSLDNAVVVSGDKVLNEGGLRYGDEFVRHKILDSVGDLYLAGAPILGHFRGVKSGHALNNLLLRKMLADPTAWTYTTELAIVPMTLPALRPVEQRMAVGA